MNLKRIAHRALRALGREMVTTEKAQYFRQMETDVDYLMTMVMPFLPPDLWKGQLRQDVFVALATKFKRNGYFVEFGATDGVLHSNTHALEKGLEWRGILCEPCPDWHAGLFRNRNCIVDTRCVWTETGASVDFSVAPEPELSGITGSLSEDGRNQVRTAAGVINVPTVTLSDLLRGHSAPKNIDYLSIDTEGSEYDILKEHDFNEYCFHVITCEHNFTEMREKIYALLSEKGYERVLPSISRWDDWYILRRYDSGT